jgi:LysM repeat protein
MKFRLFFRIVCIPIGLFFIASCTPASITEVPRQKVGLLTPFKTLTPSSTSLHQQTITQNEIATPTPAPQVYKVKKDELGSTIALRYGITLQMLQSSNPGVDLNFLKENQELIIPPMQNTPAPDLSSPTPAVLTVNNLACYPASEGAGWCIGDIRNDLSDAVMYITGEFVLKGADQTWQKSFTSMLTVLTPGKQIPVIALFDAPFSYPYQVTLLVHTAIRQAPSTLGEKIEILDQKMIIDPNGLAVKIEGKIKIIDPKNKQVAIIAAGYSEGKPAGIRRLELFPEKNNEGILPFQIWLYSVGPPIDQVEIFVENN